VDRRALVGLVGVRRRRRRQRRMRQRRRRTGAHLAQLHRRTVDAQPIRTSARRDGLEIRRQQNVEEARDRRRAAGVIAAQVFFILGVGRREIGERLCAGTTHRQKAFVEQEHTFLGWRLSRECLHEAQKVIQLRLHMLGARRQPTRATHVTMWTSPAHSHADRRVRRKTLQVAREFVPIAVRAGSGRHLKLV
jgi:hypothetical protein